MSNPNSSCFEKVWMDPDPNPNFGSSQHWEETTCNLLDLSTPELEGKSEQEPDLNFVVQIHVKYIHAGRSTGWNSDSKTLETMQPPL